MFKYILLSIGLFHLASSSPVNIITQTGIIESPNLQSNQSCVVCEFVIHILEDLAVDNYTEPEAEKLLELICNNLFPTPIRTECSSFVAQYGKIVISLLVNGVDPKKVCRTILLCPKTQDPQPVEETVPLVVIDSAAKNDALECTLCVYFGQLVQDLLSQNKTVGKITTELEEVCNIFPSDLKSQCTAFLDEYLPEVIRLLDSEIQPEQACSYLKLCPKSMAHDVFKRKLVNTN